MNLIALAASFLFCFQALQAADPYCSRGFKSYDSQVCCPNYCGRCGGAGCEQLPGSYWECCIPGVLQKNRQCSWSEAPCTLAAAQQSSPVRRSVNIAMMPGDPNKDIYSRMSQYGARVDSVLIYQNVQWLSWPYVKSLLDSGLKVELTLEFFDNYPNLWDISGGKYDYKLTQFFYQARNDGRHLNVRFLHEFNGDWYNWGALAGGSNSFEAFKAAFRRVSNVIRGTGANVSIMIQHNCLNARGDPTSFANMDPGQNYYDGACVSSYNFCGMDPWHSRNIPLKEVISPWYNAMVSMGTKPLCIAEMGTTGSCGGKEDWIRNAWNDLAYQFPRIKTVTWFLQNKWYIREDLDLNSWSQIQAWKDGMWGFKNAVGYTQGDEIAVTAAQEAEVNRARKKYEKELQARGLNTTLSAEIPHHENATAHKYFNTTAAAHTLGPIKNSVNINLGSKDEPMQP